MLAGWRESYSLVIINGSVTVGAHRSTEVELNG